jgi:small subunit ribosomal protein S16
MLIIRLQRVGKKNEPTFRIVLTDSKNGPKSGKFLEILGSYDARDKNESKVKEDRVKELIANGAQVSDTVHNFLITKGVIEGNKVNALPKKSPIVDEEKLKAEEEAKAKAAEETSTEEEAPVTEETVEAPAEEKTEEAPKEDAPVAEETPAEEPAKEEEEPAEENVEEKKEA